MPDPDKFLAGFHLINGTQFGGYILKSATATHESIVRYQEYRYQIRLIFSGGNNYQNLFYAVTDEISQTHDILATRNYYRCSIDYPKLGDILENQDGSYTWHLIGHAYRI
jgi:hypothetical protein